MVLGKTFDQILIEKNSLDVYGAVTEVKKDKIRSCVLSVNTILYSMRCEI